MEQREGFLFYRSFYEAIHSLPKKDRLCAYEALIEYALNGTEPELSGAPAAVFTLAKPNLDASKRKAESGKRGGQARSKTQANGKQTGSKCEAIKDKGLRIKDIGQGIKEEPPEDPSGDASEVVSAYLNRVNPSASQTSIDELATYVGTVGRDACLRAIDIALDAKAANWPYIRAILRKWQSLGVKCLADIDRLDKRPEKQGGKRVTCSDYSSAETNERMRREAEELEKLMRGDPSG